MNRAALAELGIELPLLPTSLVGSLPKPPDLVAARTQFARGILSQRALDDLSEEAMVWWLRRQDDAGLDVLVDGELYRGDLVAYFADALDGMAIGGLVRSYGNRYYRKPVIRGPVHWEQPITIGWWRFAQRHAKRPVKAIVTGPYTMMDWSFDEHYASRREACFALADALRNEVVALAEAGARIIQIDEPALSVRPHELPWIVEALHRLTDGIRAYWILHACYGAFETVYPGMLALPVHNLDLAVSQSAVDWLEIFRRERFTKDLSLGVVDVHSRTIESAEAVGERIERALDLVPAAALWVTPDCGLKTRQPDEAIAKIDKMVAGVHRVRARAAAPGGPS